MKERVTKTTDAMKETSARRMKTSNLPRKNSAIDHVLHIQRTLGNQAKRRLFKAGMIQAKLGLGRPVDRFEREADRGCRSGNADA